MRTMLSRLTLQNNPRSSLALRGGAAPISAAVLLLLFGTLSVQAALPGRDWWFSASADAAWINKPLSEIQSAADHGDAAGQYYLGRAFFFGQGGQRDMTNAFLWIRRSAEQG